MRDVLLVWGGGGGGGGGGMGVLINKLGEKQHLNLKHCERDGFTNCINEIFFNE